MNISSKPPRIHGLVPPNESLSVYHSVTLLESPFDCLINSFSDVYISSGSESQVKNVFKMVIRLTLLSQTTHSTVIT